MDALDRYTVFLGGTCNNSEWRDELIPFLKEYGVKYFNPVVEDWTLACQEHENKVKGDPNTINLFVITSDMIGVYSIAEAVDSAHRKPDKTILKIFPEGFNKAQLKSLQAVGALVVDIGAIYVPPNIPLSKLAWGIKNTIESVGAKEAGK